MHLVPAPTSLIDEHLRAYHWVAFVLMIVAPVSASWLMPRASWYEYLGRPDYQVVIPTQFGDWVDEGNIPNVLITAEQADIIKAIYTQTLSRIYVHKPSGRRIMMSVAHGLDQKYPHEMHWPEVCYPAQGFLIEKSVKDQIAIGKRTLNVTRMTVTKGQTTEQVMYWMRTGDQVTRGSLQLNMARIRLALRGYVADGLLFVTSEVAAEPTPSDVLQNQFISDLLNSVTPAEQTSLIGETLL
jgi:EpsI family protein